MSLKLIFITIITLLLSSCATIDLSLSESAEKDFHKAENLVEDEQYARAAQFLGKFTAKYPYSAYLIPAKVLRIKAAYLNHEYILSETLAARFVDSHPTHPERDYAEYILGMSYFNQSESANHEQIFSKKARDTFAALNNRNPANVYAKEAKEKLQMLTNRIAEHEMIIGKFYLERERYVGAVNRFIVVKNNFITTNVAAESLYWLASAYLAIQQQVYAEEVIAELTQNFPENEWQKKAANLL